MIYLEIYGDTSSLKYYHKQRLLDLYKSSGCSFFPQDEEFLLELAWLTKETNKEIGVLLDSKGKIHQVFLGDHRSIQLPSEAKKDLGKFGFLHTHPDSSGELSALDQTAYDQMGYKWMGALGEKDGQPSSLSILMNLNEEKFYRVLPWQSFFDDGLQKELQDHLGQKVSKEKEILKTKSTERVFLVGVELPRSWPIEESLAELTELVETAGGIVVGSLSQKREGPESGTFIGQGKMETLAEQIQLYQVDTVVFDDELTGIQQRNLEVALQCKVIDRTALILDIFAQRARSYEGKLQVELAQLQYQLTRLTGRGIMMSRLGGGIGTRGPGETKLEVDRRHLHSRISQVQKKMKEIQGQRASRRETRMTNEIPTAALIGYTNAGKSTLMNALTDSDVYAENQLFATLDPTVRKLLLPSGREVLLSDTVGFINKLPHKLVHAFKATLEEIGEANVILEVLDVSDPNWSKKQIAVQEVLKELSLEAKERILLLNKIDQVTDSHSIEKALRQGNTFAVSAVTKEGLPDFLEYLENILFRSWKKRTYLFPYSEGDRMHQMHELAKILHSEYLENGVEVIAEVPEKYLGKWVQWEKVGAKDEC